MPLPSGPSGSSATTQRLGQLIELALLRAVLCSRQTVEEARRDSNGLLGESHFTQTKSLGSPGGCANHRKFVEDDDEDEDEDEDEDRPQLFSANP